MILPQKMALVKVAFIIGLSWPIFFFINGLKTWQGFVISFWLIIINATLITLLDREMRIMGNNLDEQYKGILKTLIKK